MKLIESIKIGLINYIKLQNEHPWNRGKSKQCRYFKNIEDKNILDHLQKMPVPDSHKYGMFTKGDDGLKRAKFLLSKLDEWQEQN